MENLEKIRQIYGEYMAAMEEYSAKNSGWRGMFNTLAFGPGSGDYSSLRFAEKLQEALTCRVEDPEELKAIFDYMLDAAWEQRDNAYVSIMLTAMHGKLIPLVKELDKEQVQELLARYDSRWPGKARTPVMKDFAKSLEAHCK